MSEPDDPVAAAADTLYGAPLGEFVAVRKQLADARKAAGDKTSAAAIAKLARPAMSAWVVNRLWREAEDEVSGLLAAGNRVRAGDRGGLEVQRALLGKLRAKAAAVLVGGGHAASPATLQRIATTLQALSALGTWEPDRPGQLVADRDPPGFDVMLGAVLDGPAPAAPAATPAGPAPAPDPAALAAAERARRRAAERAALVAAATAARREAGERAAERDRALVEVETARGALARAVARAEAATADAATATARATRADADLAAHDAEA